MFSKNVVRNLKAIEEQKLDFDHPRKQKKRKIIVSHEIIMFGISPMTTEMFTAPVRFRDLQFSSPVENVRRVIERYVKTHARFGKIRYRRAAHANKCQVPCILSSCTNQVCTRTPTTLHLARLLLQ